MRHPLAYVNTTAFRCLPGLGEAADGSEVSKREAMTLETVLSVGMLGGFIWVVRFMLPKARKERDPLALTSAVLTAVLALLAWLLIGVAARSMT